MLTTYAIAAVTVIYALIYVDGQLQAYTALWSFVFLLISIELERWMRVAFIRHMLLVDSRRTAIAAAENEATQIVRVAQAGQTAAENAAQILELNNNAHLASKEQELLRSIMGNVAHDMKTPLHSIIAELDYIHDAIVSASTEVVSPETATGTTAPAPAPAPTATTTATAITNTMTCDTDAAAGTGKGTDPGMTAAGAAGTDEHRKSGHSNRVGGTDTGSGTLSVSVRTDHGRVGSGSTHANSTSAVGVFDRLIATTDDIRDTIMSQIQFLVMSINRSQDFVKLSSNVVLKPKLETASIPDVIHFVTKCMGHQNNGRSIVVHALVSTELLRSPSSHILVALHRWSTLVYPYLTSPLCSSRSLLVADIFP